MDDKDVDKLVEAIYDVVEQYIDDDFLVQGQRIEIRADIRKAIENQMSTSLKLTLGATNNIRFG